MTSDRSRVTQRETHRGGSESARLAAVRVRGELWVTTPTGVTSRWTPEPDVYCNDSELGETLAEAAAGPDGLVWVTDKQRSLMHRAHADGGGS